MNAIATDTSNRAAEQLVKKCKVKKNKKNKTSTAKDYFNNSTDGERGKFKFNTKARRNERQSGENQYSNIEN